jgi:hypothetical protein
LSLPRGQQHYQKSPRSPGLLIWRFNPHPGGVTRLPQSRKPYYAPGIAADGGQSEWPFVNRGRSTVFGLHLNYCLDLKDALTYQLDMDKPGFCITEKRVDNDNEQSCWDEYALASSPTKGKQSKIASARLGKYQQYDCLAGSSASEDKLQRRCFLVELHQMN